MSKILLIILICCLMVIGLVGTLIPILPGLPLIYFAFLIYGLLTHWQDYGIPFMLIWGMITFLLVIIDYYAGALGAKKYGASSAGIWGAVIGGILGVIFLGFLGIILGPIFGAFTGELLSGKSKASALQASWGTFIGFLAGSMLNVITALVMIGSFIWQIW